MPRVRPASRLRVGNSGGGGVSACNLKIAMTALLPPQLGPPVVPPIAVPRPELVRRLDTAVKNHKLTLLVAPAGSGKSVLLGQWAESPPMVAAAWLTAEAGHNDATRFANDLVAALNMLDDSLGAAALERLETSGLAAGGPFIEAL